MTGIMTIIDEPISTGSNYLSILQAFPEFSKLRIYGTIDEPLFKIGDIFDLLNVKRNRHLQRDGYEEGADFIKVKMVICNKQVTTNVFTESGLYGYLARNRLPVGKRFRNFIVNAMVVLRTNQTLELELCKQKLIEFSKYPELEPLPIKTYIIVDTESVGDRWVKIGKSIDVRKRLSQIQVGTPHKLEIWHVFDSDIEKQLHNYIKFNYESIVTRGEWFLLSESLCNKIKSIFG